MFGVTPVGRHQSEIERNRKLWESKPLLRSIYSGFYGRIVRWINPDIPGPSVEIGSGVGNLKQRCPRAIATDLFPNPWLDLVCDAYRIPFIHGSLSHLILFDVFHHLRTPRAFLNEAARVLHPAGRVIVFDPYISWTSHLAYGLFHPEPVAWRGTIDLGGEARRPTDYYAAQGNATRLFFRDRDWLEGWHCLRAEAFSAFGYLLSGGYSKPAFYPAQAAGCFERLDRFLSRWPRLFGARCLVVLEKAKNPPRHGPVS